MSEKDFVVFSSVEKCEQVYEASCKCGKGSDCGGGGT